VNKIEDLRDLMFDTLKDLRDKEKPMDVERARAIADVAKVIVDSAKVEVDHMKIAGGTSAFLPSPEAEKPAAPGQPRLVRGRDMRG
jgi:hypothetical protein